MAEGSEEPKVRFIADTSNMIEVITVSCETGPKFEISVNLIVLRTLLGIAFLIDWQEFYFHFRGLYMSRYITQSFHSGKLN